MQARGKRINIQNNIINYNSKLQFAINHEFCIVWCLIISSGNNNVYVDLYSCLIFS